MLRETVSGSSIELVFLNVSEYTSDLDFYESRHVNKASYFRVFLSEILFDIEKVIYIDPDTVVMSDISSLLYLNNNSSLTGVAEVDFSNIYYTKSNTPRDKVKFGDYQSLYEYFKFYMGFEDRHITEYVNAGVLVLNLHKIRKEYGRQLIDLCVDRHFMFHDQDILNLAFKDDKTIVDITWNCPNRLFNDVGKDNIKILHAYSTDHGKPWFSYETSGAYLFWCNLRETPFYEHLTIFDTLNVHEKSTSRINATIKSLKDLVNINDKGIKDHINSINAAIKDLRKRYPKSKKSIISRFKKSIISRFSRR